MCKVEERRLWQPTSTADDINYPPVAGRVMGTFCASSRLGKSVYYGIWKSLHISFRSNCGIYHNANISCTTYARSFETSQACGSWESFGSMVYHAARRFTVWRIEQEAYTTFPYSFFTCPLLVSRTASSPRFVSFIILKSIGHFC